MKIGIDCRIFSSNFTGIGRYTHEIVNHLIEINKKQQNPHEFVLFFNPTEYKEFPELPHAHKIKVNAKYYSFAEQTEFLRTLNKENCDLVHFPHFNIPILYRKPYIVTIHDLTLSFFPGQKMTRWYHRLAYHFIIKNTIKTAKKIIAVSNNTKKDIIKYFRIPEQKITTIYNGISPKFQLITDAGVPIRTAKKYKIDLPFLLYTGVWRNHKNLTRLIEAFSIIKKQKQLDLKLVITGKPDPHYPEVRQAVKKYDLTEEVIFPGLVSEQELVHLYNAAFIYVFPSLYEGFGFPPLESMACGTPVTASNTSSIPEICGEDNAIFFNPYDAGDIANKVESLYKDAGKQAELIEKGMRHVQQFSWQRNAKKLYEMYHSGTFD